MRTKDAAPIQLSEAEWKVMRCVWSRETANSREVLEELHAETRWAYTTVKTLLDRLVEKGALEFEMRANTAHYKPLVTRFECRRSAVRSLLNRAFDGALSPLLHHLIEEEKLSKKDRAALMQMLQDAAKPRKTK